MTTAHRPTWKAAVGQANEGGWFAGGAISSQQSTLDAPAHKRLKFRQSHQVVDKKKDLIKSLLELEEAEVQISSLPRKPADPLVEERAKKKLLQQTAEVDLDRIKGKYDDSDIDDNVGTSDGSDLDNDSDLEGDSDGSRDDDDDDEAALEEELAKIRAEREAAKRKQDEEAATEDKTRQEQAAVLGNPLLVVEAPNNGRMKRRWNDDVVFRNQAKGEPAAKKRFINDTVRNDFHKRFLNKFIR